MHVLGREVFDKHVDEVTDLYSCCVIDYPIVVICVRISIHVFVEVFEEVQGIAVMTIEEVSFDIIENAVDSGSMANSSPIYTVR